MSCPSPTRCFAGGNYSDGDNHGMLLTGSQAHWSARKAALPVNATANPDATVAGMSCPTATWCTAVGQYSDADGNQYALLLRLAGRNMNRHRRAGPRAGRRAPGRLPRRGLLPVHHPVLRRRLALRLLPLMLTWHSGKGMAVKVPLPAGAAVEPSASIAAISCPATTGCVAVGDYLGGRGTQQGFVLTWSGTSWTA